MSEENKVVVMNPQAPEEEVIVVRDGRINVKIQNEFGEQLGVFRFNPSDVNIVNRYNEIAKQFADVVHPLADANISAEGEGEDADSATLINDAEEEMIRLMDYMLNGDSKKAFFEKTHAFSPTEDGAFFCEKVMEAIGGYIEHKMNVRLEQIEKRISKHTHGYRTGKHRKGDR